MKRILFVMAWLIVGTTIHAQSGYKTIKDEPEDAANIWLNLELLQFEINMNNLRSSNLGIGVSGAFQIKNRFGIEAAARHSYFALHFKGEPRFQIEAGGFFNYARIKKTKRTKITSGGVSYYPNVTKMTSFGVRSGYASNKESYKDDKNKFGGGDYKYQFGGLYAGLLFTVQANHVIHTSANRMASLNFLTKFYLDALIYPKQSMIDRSSGALAINFAPGIIGGRFGIEQLIPEKKKNYGGYSYIKYELGYRPVDGLYFMFTYGISWKDKIRGLNGYKQIREKE